MTFSKIYTIGLLAFAPFLIAGAILLSANSWAQSDNCATATSITLVSGTACVNGTTLNATTNNTMYGSCNPSPVNEVWFTYVATGSVNDYTITSNGITNLEIVIDITGCTDNVIATCATQTGTNTLNTSWGVPAGTQVWIMVASNGGTEGNFQLCINSLPPAPSSGNICSSAISVCDVTQTYNTPNINVLTSSGTWPSCFGNSVNQDIWYQFTVTQTGVLEWEATPLGANIELDWALYDITSGCPGTEMVCNYNYTLGASGPAGMIMGAPCPGWPCPLTNDPGLPCGEYCDPITVTAGNTYAIVIDNYTSTLNTGLDFVFGPGMTALIAPSANFSISPSTLTCGASVTVSITNTSLGTPDWNFGNGNTYTGTSPPAQTYTTPGTYAITATISGSCPSVHTEFVNLYGPLVATTATVNAGCGGCTGQASVSATGGDGIYSYSWSNFAATPSISGLCSGNYSVTVTNTACGSSVVANVTITDAGTNLGFTSSGTNPLCVGAANGTTSATGTTGTPPYTYLWSNGQFTSTATGLLAGIYTVTITDSAGCDTITTVTISDPSPVIINVAGLIITNASCSSSDGSITGITASGGTAPLTYAWVDSSMNLVGNSLNLTNLPSGNYSFAVADANGCLVSSGPYSINATGGTTVSATNTTALCFGQCNGTGTAVASGGTPPYFYAWGTSPIQNTATAVALCAGTYTVTVTDASCTASGIELVTNGNFSSGNTGFSSSYYFCNSGGCLGPEGGYGIGPSGGFYNGGFSGTDHTTGSGNFMVVNGSTSANTNVWCQTIAVTPNSTYQFSTWVSSLNTSNTAILQFSINGVNLGTTFNAPNSTGVWLQFFQVWNSGSNTSAAICIVNQNTAGGGNDFGLDDISFQQCINACPSTASVVISEPGVLSFSLTKTDASCFSLCNGTATALPAGGISPYTYAWSNSISTSTDTGLCSGNYSVTVTDFNGCTLNQSITINQPTQLLATGSTVAAKCGGSNGSATVNPFGGATPYSFSWNDLNNQTTQTATNLLSQTYNATVIDANGCTFTIPISVGTINGPSIDTIVGSDLNCAGSNDGTAAVTVSGGSLPYTYLWNDSAATAAAAAASLPAGTYSVTVTDLYGCDTIRTITINEPAAVLVNVSGTDTLCFGQSGQLAVVTSGGIGLYSYSWDNALPPVDTVNISSTVTTTYNVTVTDANGCSDNDSALVFVYSPLAVSASNTAICEGDTISLFVNPSQGNGGPYSYLWSDGSTNSTLNVSPTLLSSFSVVINDGCSTPVTTSMIVNVNVKPAANFAMACYPDSFISQFSDSSIISSGSIASWAWDFGDNTTSDVQHPQHDYSSTGSFTVSLTVVSDQGCMNSYSEIIQSPPDAGFTLSPLETTTANPNIEFTDFSSKDVEVWMWNFGDGDTTALQTPVFFPGDTVVHIYDSAGIYGILLTVINAMGCIDTAINYVQILDEYAVFAPNAFTPNGNGNNDFFMPVGIGIDKNNFELLIFDRWGDLIYNTTDLKMPWDGKANGGKKPAQEDVYVWVIRTLDPGKKKHQYVGHVTLIR